MKRARLTPSYKLRRLAKDPQSWGEPAKVIDAAGAEPGSVLDIELPRDTYIVDDPDAFLARVHADIAAVIGALK